MNMMRKVIKMSKEIKDWISKPGNHLYKHNGNYILNSGYFSGDDIPVELQNTLSWYYENFGSIEVEFVSA